MHRITTLLFLTCLFTVGSFGCTDPIPEDECKNAPCEEEEEEVTCQTGAECDVGKTCLLNQCVDPPPCDTTDDCPEGECVQNQCIGDRAPTNNDTNGGTNGGTNGATNGDTNGDSNNRDWPLRLCHSETDDGDDGLLERTRDLEYDDDGVKVAEEQRNQDIEDWNYRETYTYDADGLRIRADRDIGFDDTVDERTTYEYDDQNRLVEEREDRDVDGTIDSTREITYDADGRQVRERIIWPGDEVHRVREFIYDGDGNLTEETTDFDDDGVDSRTFHDYDDDGNRIETRYDFDNDGTLDHQTTHTFEEGRRTRSETDDDGDGMIDEVTTYEYGPGGREVLQTKETAVGELLSTRATAYDDMDAGIDVRGQNDTDGDGSVDQTTLSNWRYDPACEID